jgi:thioredoxin 1
MSLEITSFESFKKMLYQEEKKIIIVKFSAKWCNPCKKIHPLYDFLAEKEKNKILSFHVDVDELEDMASFYEIKSLPTFLVFSNKKVIDKLIGANRIGLENMFSKYHSY